KMDLLSPYEFVKLQEEMRGADYLKSTYYKDGTTLDYYLNPTKEYNWQDEVYQTAMTQSHSVNMSGGTNQSKFNSTLSYFNQDGVIIGSNYSRIQGKINFDNRLFSDKVLVNMNLNYSDNKTTGSSPSNYGSLPSNALMYSLWTYRPVSYDANQDLLEDNYDPVINGSSDYRFNPVKSVKNEYRVNIDRTLAANGSIQIDIVKNLRFKSSVGYNLRNRQN
ncbi:SusC/RagA family TonB-linked outer membrane protein, partial [bacterium]|nr:SusC/RagA family TonB-linked outer membrane protein [bacterium]